ncbi:MAG: DUF362 domain-containing protein [Spirochaetales bacterium]|nr:DUF362 domain-containing protein [Spirochaetales bacterium]
MGRVSIVKTEPDLKQALHRALEFIGGIGSFIGSEDSVLLKPNLNDFDCITNPGLVEALITYLFDNNIKKLMIAESTFGNHHITEKHFRHSGYYDICKKYDIPLVNLNKSGSIEMKVPNPLIFNTIHLAKEVREVTKIINIPVMKVHYATGVTLGLKNLKGFLTPDEKKHFHAAGLDKGIVDLGNTIPVDLTLIDGINCMERMGPKGGDVFYLGLLLAGRNIGETDYIASKIMGYDLHEVKHLSYFMTVNKVDVNNIQVCGEKCENVIRRFLKVKTDMIIPKNIRIYNHNACSACMNALLLSFRFFKEEFVNDADIYIGSEQAEIKESPGIKVAFGNCCTIPGAHVTIKGCPPYPLLLVEKLK